MEKQYSQSSGSVTDAARAEICRRAVEVEPPRVRRGRPRAGLRRWTRKDRGTVYLLGDGKPQPLGVKADRKEEAAEAFRVRHDAALGRQLGHVAPLRIPLSAVFEYEKELIHPGSKATIEQLQAYDARVMKLDRLSDFLGRDLLVGEVTPARCRAYERWMLKQPARPRTKSAKPFEPGTVRVDLAWLRRAIKRYAWEHNLHLAVNVYVPPRPAPRQNWLDRDDIAVLVASALWGWSWNRDLTRMVERKVVDPETGDESYELVAKPGDWVTKEVVDPQTGKASSRRVVHPSYARPDVRARGRALARALVTGFYTGTRSLRLRDLGWTRHPHFGWLDVESGLIDRAGVRSGEFAGPGRARKKAGAAYMPEPLLRLARRWRASDARDGFSAVIHQPNGSRYFGKGSITAALKRVGRRCGYQDVMLHELRHSTVTVCLLNGCSVADTANFVDMSVEMVQKVYGHLAEQGTLAGAAAMSVKGGSRLSPSRDQADDMPRESMTPQKALEARLKLVRLKAAA